MILSDEMILSNELKYARDQLLKMAKKYMPKTDPNVIVDFYLKKDGWPTKPKELVRKYGLSMRICLGTMSTFRERICSRGSEMAEITLNYLETRRKFLWNNYSRYKRRSQKKQKD